MGVGLGEGGRGNSGGKSWGSSSGVFLDRGRSLGASKCTLLQLRPRLPPHTKSVIANQCGCDIGT